MHNLNDYQLENVQTHFLQAADVAKEATCYQAKCGSVIIKDGIVIGQGFNGPALHDDANRTCGFEYDLSIKPKYDKTCCIHAEWRAILDACVRNPEKLPGSTLYFIRIDESSGFTDAGEPYCTTCSRLALESGIG